MSYKSNNRCKVYVGNLPGDIRERDLEDVFYKYGKIVGMDLHNGGRGERPGAPFAFVEFDDPRDADDAVKEKDGHTLDGYKIRVEFPRGPGYKERGSRGGGGGRGYDNYGGGRREGPRSMNRPKGHSLMIHDLPPSGSWQDVKDHFRPAGEVLYAAVFHDGTGTVEFARYEDMKRARRELNDSKFRSHEGEVSHIRVKGKKASRSPSPGGRSRRRYASRSRSRSR